VLDSYCYLTNKSNLTDRL